jgi:hypothetical protein
VTIAGDIFEKEYQLNLANSSSDVANAATIMADATACADCEADHGLVLVTFVQALAKRQARLDAGMPFDAANDNRPRILH